MAQLVLSKVPQGTVSLGGWSYRGVVAVEAAKVLKTTAPAVEVDALLLFDSPLILEPEAKDNGIDATPVAVAAAGGLEGVQAAAEEHFAHCTRLLRARRQDWGQDPSYEAVCQRALHVVAGQGSALLGAPDVLLSHFTATEGVHSAHVVERATHWDLLSNADFRGEVAASVAEQRV